jgi:hypothetical protein
MPGELSHHYFTVLRRLAKLWGAGVTPEKNAADSGLSPGQKRYKWI